MPARTSPNVVLSVTALEGATATLDVRGQPTPASVQIITGLEATLAYSLQDDPTVWVEEGTTFGPTGDNIITMFSPAAWLRLTAVSDDATLIFRSA